ncbi:F0F1 ATP synthase subunit alpha [candidate division WOR-1 bacterium RIFOXYB2_FULL_37_13]|uniref:ATP synthase subunit alpha n=1 Tax=candidate division WOR-1 bacterium RIFOXYB2_FULL_37_13 TaxID=1802579 RepID=A0A1F4SYD1_UNCSA|nr:MAG: F0F1 ATP synthase subunit alpha [candidate division WOR-1 bacterium RIFOXYB2_FULL_37_13]
MKNETPSISDILKKKILEFEAETKAEYVGKVIESGDGIAHIKGLPQAMAGEMIEFQSGIFGLVFNLERDQIVAVILGSHTSVKEGMWAKCTGRVMEVPVGEALIGRIVNGVGVPLDGKGDVVTGNHRPVERLAPAVVDRVPVDRPLQTGIKLIDALVPIGRGQRELIIGDRSTGKSAILVDTILNQKKEGVICVYVSIGQKTSDVVQMTEKLRRAGAMDYTIVVTASASDPGALQYLAPFTGCAMAEEFMYKGKDVLIVYDDLTKHAQAYRMISILLRRPPGREAYPGDVFYLHSRLLERSAQLSPKLGGGSMTALPIIETQLGDVSSYIPTNVISITDGQIFLESDLFNAGVRPAVNVGISVSRVGGNAQTKAIRKLAGRLRLDLAQYREKAQFSLFSEDVDKETKAQLLRGQIVTEVMKQDKNQPMAIEDQVVVLFAAVNGFFDEVPVATIRTYESELLSFMHRSYHEVLDSIRDKKDIDEESRAKMIEAVSKFKELFNV